MLDKKILEMKDENIQAVRESIMIKSVESEKKGDMPFGEGVQKVLENALELSKNLGFKTVNLDNMVGYAEYGEGDEMVAVLGHLDVVPEGDGWTYPPYGGEIHDGKLYGRGALDDKGPTIGALFALKAIKDLGLPLKRRVRVIFGTNEESGSRGVRHYVERDEMPVAGFTPDAEYPIINAEKGIITCNFKRNFNRASGKTNLVSITGGTVSNVVPDYAEAIVYGDSLNKADLVDKYTEITKGRKLRFELEDADIPEHLKIKVFGVSAHGSTPHLGENAISGLIHFLSKLDLEEEMKKFMIFMKENIGYETDGKSLSINIKDDVSGELTFNLGTIKGNCDEISFSINIRYPVTKKDDDFMKTLTDKMSTVGLSVEHIDHAAPLYVSPEEEFIKKLQKVYTEKTGDEAKLLAIGGGTYAKSMKNIVAFGPTFPGEEGIIHKPDEYITIDSLIKNVQIMAAAMYELAN